MQFIEGKLLHTKSVKTKNGALGIISILDEYETFSKVVDIADFEDSINGFEVDSMLKIPIKTRVAVSEKSGNAFLNYAVAGKIEPLVA